MKKIAPYVILFLFALLLWDVLASSSHWMMHIDGEEFDGPLGALLALLFAGGGAIIGALALVVAGVVLAVVFAGVGVIVLGALAVAALALALAISPLLLPLLVPVAIIWIMASRSRKNREAREQAV
jgi:hypothetical protein